MAQREQAHEMLQKALRARTTEKASAYLRQYVSMMASVFYYDTNFDGVSSLSVLSQWETVAWQVSNMVDLAEARAHIKENVQI